MTAPWTYEIVRYPLCNTVQGTSFALKPPTAAVRILNLSSLSLENILQFLVELDRKMGNSTISLRDHFDIIIASEYGKLRDYKFSQKFIISTNFDSINQGVFFLITIFLEGWSFEVCKYHLRRSKQPIVNEAGNINFRERLAWT